MFDAFVQLDDSTSKRYAGAGLGLSISRALAKHMGFEIRVDSVEGSGSVFSVVFDPEAEGPSWRQPDWAATKSA